MNQLLEELGYLFHVHQIQGLLHHHEAIMSSESVSVFIEPLIDAFLNFVIFVFCHYYKLHCSVDYNPNNGANSED